jgi:hypothetical protein
VTPVRRHNECEMNPGFRSGSWIRPYKGEEAGDYSVMERKRVAEMLRSATIVVMGLVVIGAGVVVVFYG